MDSSSPCVDALILKDGRIFAAGTERELRKHGPFSEETDFGNKIVMPAFHDNHLHPIDSGVEFSECRLYDATSVKEILERVARCDAALPPEVTWLRASGWSPYLFRNGELPHHALLDQLGLSRPVALLSTDGHSYWVNDKALKLLGVTRDTKDPEHGNIIRDASGEPTGVFNETALSIVNAGIPPRSPLEMKQGLVKALALMHEAGITSFKDAYVTEEHLKIYAELDQEGGLTATAYMSLFAEPKEGLAQLSHLKDLRKTYTSQNIRIETIKIFLDGTIEDRTAALSAPYAGSTNQGSLLWDRAALLQFAIEAERAGFQLHFHAIGDAAVTLALDSIEAARNRIGNYTIRHEIAHIQVAVPSDWSRFAQLGVNAVFSPVWAMRDEAITVFSEPALGPTRSKWLYPIGSVLKAGGTLAFGSDWAVTSVNPWEGIQVAVTRAPLTPSASTPSETWMPEQTIPLQAAIRGYLRSALRVGADADFMVLDQNPFKLDPSQLSSVKVLSTYRHGVKVSPQTPP